MRIHYSPYKGTMSNLDIAKLQHAGKLQLVAEIEVEVSYDIAIG